MTPFELDVLLHYYGHADDHPHMFNPPPIWRETILRFIQEAVLQENAVINGQLYSLTERGRCYIDYILALPLPRLTYTMEKP